VSPALLVNCPASALAAYHSSVIIIPARVTPSPARAFDQALAVTDGRGLIADGAVMSLTDILLLAMGAITFAAALTVVIGIASRVISVA
jgi:hypothetical protein